MLAQHLVYSRVAGQPKEYVQDRMRAQSDVVAGLLGDAKTHIYICGLRGMEAGVEEALSDIARGSDLDWLGLRDRMRQEGRYHVETY